MLLILSSFQWYLKCLYKRHFLRRYKSQTKTSTTQAFGRPNWILLEDLVLKFGLCLPETLGCDMRGTNLACSTVGQLQLTFLTKKNCPLCNCHNFFSSFHYADNFVIKVLLILSSFQWYLKCLYKRHFLRRYKSQTKTSTTQAFGRPNWILLEDLVLKFGLCLPETLGCDMRGTNLACATVDQLQLTLWVELFNPKMSTLRP